MNGHFNVRMRQSQCIDTCAGGSVRSSAACLQLPRHVRNFASLILALFAPFSWAAEPPHCLACVPVSKAYSYDLKALDAQPGVKVENEPITVKFFLKVQLYGVT